MGCLRKILLALTLLIWLSGAALVGIAGFVMVQDMKFKGLTGNMLLDGVILGVACFVFVLGFIGCLGAVLQKRIILKIFFILVLFFLVIQIATVVEIVVQQAQLQSLWAKTWPGMTDDGRIAIQKELKCCGLSASDPNSQASYNDTSCFTSADMATRRNTCFDALLNWLKKHLIILVVSGGLLGLLELVVLVCTCLFIRQRTRETTVVPLNPRGPQGVAPVYHSTQNRGDRGISAQVDRLAMVEVDDEDDYIVEHTRKNWAKQSKRL